MKPTRLDFTQLESRTNPSGITFTQGHLVLTGTAAADSIHVYFYGSDTTRVAAVVQTGTTIQSKIVPTAHKASPSTAVMATHHSYQYIACDDYGARATIHLGRCRQR